MSSRPRGWHAAVAVAGLAALLGGCTGGSDTPAPTPTTPPVTSTSASTPPAERLQQLAAAGARARFHATYAVRSVHPKGHATWEVWRSASSLRVDVETKQATATLIRTPKATYSCRRAKHRRTCFRVAKGDDPIPPLFRLGAETLFSSDVSRLAGPLKRYDVSIAVPANVGLSGSVGTCFRVVPKKKSSKLQRGVYCLDTHGVITAVRYPNGNLVRRTHLTLHAPRGKAFQPYSKPTPLPS